MSTTKDMLKVERYGYWKFTPKLNNFYFDKFPMMQFFKFGVIWDWSGKKVVIDEMEYLDITLLIDDEWSFNTEMTGIMQIDYGGVIQTKRFDIKNKKEMKFEKICGWRELIHKVNNDTRLEILIWVDKHYGIDMRKTREFDKHEKGLTDGIIITNTNRYHVSKAILSLHSSFFYDQFQKSSTIDISNLDGVTVKSILDMIHAPFVLPKVWVEHGFEWQKYYTKPMEENGDDVEEVKKDTDKFRKNGRVNSDKIRSYYQSKERRDGGNEGGKGIGYGRMYYVDKYIDEDIDKIDEKEDNDKFGKTSKYQIRETAKQLKLSVVEQMAKNKFREDIMMYDYEREVIPPNIQLYSTSLYLIQSQKWNAYNSVKNVGLPICVEDSVIKTFKMEDIKNDRIMVHFLNQSWEFEINELSEENSELIRKGEGLTEERFENEEDKLDEDYLFITLRSPWITKPLMVKGKITVECNHPTRNILTRGFDTPFGLDELYIGKMLKTTRNEMDALLKVTIKIDEIDEKFERRIYLNYGIYHPVISTGKITIDNQVFHVCKQLLSYCSPIFHQLFQSSSDIKLSDISPRDFRRILNMIYPTQLLPNSWHCNPDENGVTTSISRLLEFAHKYGLDVVKSMCEQYVNDTIMRDISWQVSTAEKYNMPNLMKNGCWKLEELQKYVETPEFQLISSKMKRDIMNILDEKCKGEKLFEQIKSMLMSCDSSDEQVDEYE